MNKPFYPAQRNIYQKRTDEDPFEPVTVYLPKSLAHILKAKSDKLSLPVSRLIAYAVDNELDTVTPFNYPCIVPDTPYVPYAFAEEASKIMRYLAKFPSGTGLDMLVLCRRDIDIMSREDLLQGYRELLESKSIEEFMPTKTKFHYNREYRYIRPTVTDPKILKKTKYKKPEPMP